MVEKFQELDVDGSGKLDVDEARQGLLQVDLCESIRYMAVVLTQLQARRKGNYMLDSYKAF